MILQSQEKKGQTCQGVGSGSLWFMYYNFCRVHQTLRVTPAMEAGISDHVWSVEEMCALLPEKQAIGSQIDRALILKALGEPA